MDGRLDFYPRPSPFKMSRHPPLRTPNTRTRTLSSPTTATPPIVGLTFQHNVPTSPANGKAISALDMITEGALFFISIYIVTGLGMSFYLKAIVVCAFGIRLPVIAFSALRLNALEAEISFLDPTVLGAYTSAWTQVELDYSIIAGTLSCLGALLNPFTKEMGPSRDETQQTQLVTFIYQDTEPVDERRYTGAKKGCGELYGDCVAWCE